MKVKTEVHGGSQIMKRFWTEVAEEATSVL